MNIINQVDFYKTSHPRQYPDGTEFVYSNMTARSGKYTNIPGGKGIYFFGLTYYIKKYLLDEFNNNFFAKPKEIAVYEYARIVYGSSYTEEQTKYIGDLHDLGYLPIRIKALPEGSFVKYGVPLLTITNTHKDFYWVTNMLETQMSATLWPMITSITTAKAYLDNFYKYAEITGGDINFVPYQVHDFSLRGMFGIEAGGMSALATLASGVKGTDSIPGIELAMKYYGEYLASNVGGSVPATEHAVMCAGGIENEYETYRRLIEDIYPEGIVSIVSDTWDLWNVVDNILPKLKDKILARNGKVVIRPDSGNPADILCGNESKGLIERLYEIFGGTINEKGYKVLNPKVGAIYGEGISLKMQLEILERLEKLGFCSSNIVLGIGSYAFQLVTRDTHGIAIKATNVIINGESKPIFKDPKTDTSKTKKSAKGLIMVTKEGNEYNFIDEASPKQEKHGCLEICFEDGILKKNPTLTEIRGICNA